MAGEPTEKPAFSTRKRKMAGEIKKQSKDGFSGGASDSFAGAGGGAGGI